MGGTTKQGTMLPYQLTVEKGQGESVIPHCNGREYNQQSEDV